MNENDPDGREWLVPASPALVAPRLVVETVIRFHLLDVGPRDRVGAKFIPMKPSDVADLGHWSSELNFKYGEVFILYDHASHAWNLAPKPKGQAFWMGPDSSNVCPPSRFPFRMRCLFPECEIDSEGPFGDKCVQSTYLKHITSR
ncbi:hypothetical protein HK101_000425 [Irineochytrium annulatum]|nr:hypothetical protein HK101_000425 [Irineochytrium annulatum]